MTRLLLGLSIATTLTFEPHQIYGPGYLSSADPGVLEQAATRRLRAGWGLDKDWRDYDLLAAPADCRLLGKSGWLITEYGVRTVLIVDCENGQHKGQMAERGLLADVNRRGLAHKEGWLVLR